MADEALIRRSCNDDEMIMTRRSGREEDFAVSGGSAGFDAVGATYGQGPVFQHLPLELMVRRVAAELQHHHIRVDHHARGLEPGPDHEFG